MSTLQTKAKMHTGKTQMMISIEDKVITICGSGHGRIGHTNDNSWRHLSNSLKKDY